MPLREDDGWLPDLDAFDAWDEIALFWMCYPNNPTGAVAPLSFYEELAGARARARVPALLRRGVLGAVVRRAAGLGAAGRRPRERRRLQHALEALVDDRLPLGLRLRAARTIADALRTFRPTVGTAPQEFVQRASVAAWADDAHVEDGARALPPQARRRSCRRSRSRGCGSPAATRRSTSGSTSAARRRPFARRLLEHGIVVAPGSFFGPAGEGYVRLRARADAGRVRARGRDPPRSVL